MTRGGSGFVTVVQREGDGAQFVLKQVECANEAQRNAVFKEYRLLKMLYDSGCRVPRPIEFTMIPDSRRFGNRGSIASEPMNAMNSGSTSGGTDRQPLLQQQQQIANIVMEYFPDGDLSSYVQQFEQAALKIPERTLLRLAWRGYAVLDQMHRMRPAAIVHLDVKPQNVALNIAKGQIFLLDFGCAVEVMAPSTSGKGGTRVAAAPQQLHPGLADDHGVTPVYAPPERFTSRPTPSPAMDVWSMGATILHAALRHVPPLNEASDDGVARSLGEIERELRDAGYSSSFFELTRGAITYHPMRRATAAELSKAAGELLERLGGPPALLDSEGFDRPPDAGRRPGTPTPSVNAKGPH